MASATADLPDLAGSRVLLVEDDLGDAMLIEAALGDAGVPESAVTHVRSLADAMPLLADGPDCVLLDLGLPDAAGLGAVHKMVEAAPDVAVIVLTGRTGTGSREGVEALGAGAQDYLVKDDVTGSLLERSMRYAIERKRAQQVSQQLRDLSVNAAEQARLERGLLPTPRLQTGAVRVRTHYRPGRDDAVLGGDFYDVVEVRPGVVRAVIGDVMGHGADEAALGVQLRVAWRSLLLAGVPDDQMLPTLGRLLATEDEWDARFATVCDLTLADGVATLRVAGHPAPVVVHAGGADYAHVRVGVPLGVRPRRAAVTGWPGTSVQLPPGASLLLYTDGLLDAYTIDHAQGSIGIDELVRAVDEHPVDDDPGWIGTLLAGAPRESIDDTAIVLLTTLGPS